MSREAVLAKTLVELADTLVDDFDVVDLFTVLSDRCVEVLDVSAAGIMLASPTGDLRVVASSTETVRLLELFELQAEEGPCPDCYGSGTPVVEDDLERAGGRWPRFGPEARRAGFRAVHAFPLRLRGSVIGALNLFRTDPGRMADDDAVVAQALADVATIGVLQHRAVQEAQILNEQLTYALNSRIVLEQAKGMVAERLDLDMEQSFATLRAHARRNNLLLADVASDVISGRLAASQLAAPRRPRP